MMTSVTQSAVYTTWANRQLIQDLSSLTEDQLTTHIEASFPSIRETLRHIWLAESGWLSVIQGRDWDAREVRGFAGSTHELMKAWSETTQALEHHVMTSDMNADVTFDSRGQQYIMPAHEVVQTVFYHGSYHRGQVVMMMRQLGVSQISQTDYIHWLRAS